MKETIEAARHAGLQTKVIVGGAPVDQSFADQIGAAGWASDAASAVPLIKRLFGLV